MRTQITAVVACLTVVLMMAAPVMASWPTPNERIERFTDDPSFDPTIGIFERILSFPIEAPFYPWIGIPAGGTPVMDEDEFIPVGVDIGHEQKSVAQAR
jgi:hypothetical protein